MCCSSVRGPWNVFYCDRIAASTSLQWGELGNPLETRFLLAWSSDGVLFSREFAGCLSQGKTCVPEGCLLHPWHTDRGPHGLERATSFPLQWSPLPTLWADYAAGAVWRGCPRPGQCVPIISFAIIIAASSYWVHWQALFYELSMFTFPLMLCGISDKERWIHLAEDTCLVLGGTGTRTYAIGLYWSMLLYLAYMDCLFEI